MQLQCRLDLLYHAMLHYGLGCVLVHLPDYCNICTCLQRQSLLQLLRTVFTYEPFAVHTSACCNTCTRCVAVSAGTAAVIKHHVCSRAIAMHALLQCIHLVCTCNSRSTCNSSHCYSVLCLCLLMAGCRHPQHDECMHLLYRHRYNVFMPTLYLCTPVYRHSSSHAEDPTSSSAVCNAHQNASMHAPVVCLQSQSLLTCSDLV